MKVCSRCKIPKEALFFYPDKRASDKLQSCCKLCYSKYKKHNATQRKQQVSLNTIQFKICKGCKIEKEVKEFTFAFSSLDSFNRYCKECCKHFKSLRKEKRRIEERLYHNNRIKKDIQFYLTKRLRERLSKAIKHNQKKGSAIEDLGCSINELKNYLEKQFKPRMTWENRGTGGWHINHIKPLSSFNLEDREQLKLAVHYTNLQPLWEHENLSKGNRTI